MKCIVTGGSGFIGQHLVSRLLDDGHMVKVLDVKQPSIRPTQHLSHQIVDVRNYVALSAACAGYDIIYHLASMVGVVNCMTRPGEVAETTVMGTRNVIKAAQANSIDKILFTSTSEVYGNGPLPFTESDDGIAAVAPITAYGAAKLTAEYMLRECKDHDITVRIVRYFNVYGPGESDDFVVARFIKQALNGEPLTVYLDGSQTRCFTYIDDAIEGTILAAESDGRPYEVYNIGTSTSTSIAELADVINNEVGGPRLKGEADTIVQDMEDSEGRDLNQEIFDRTPSVDKALRQLNFLASVSLRDGIVQTARAIARSELAAARGSKSS